MARHRSGSDDTVAVLREFFMIAPCWMCPVAAGMIYLALAYMLPAMLGSSELLAGLGDLPRLFAPYLAAAILLMGISISLKKRGSGMMLDRQRGADTISALSWQEFEQLLAAAFRRQGYGVVDTGRGADGGIDLVLHGKEGRVAVQCKHWRSQKVGVTLVRELNGVIHARTSRANRGIFVTFGDYTQEARRFARENGIELIDRPKLLAMIDAARRDAPPKVVPEASTTPSCPLCGSAMVLRTARYGSNAGSQFWGCSTYPKCRGITKQD